MATIERQNFKFCHVSCTHDGNIEKKIVQINMATFRNPIQVMANAMM